VPSSFASVCFGGRFQGLFTSEFFCTLATTNLRWILLFAKFSPAPYAHTRRSVAVRAGVRRFFHCAISPEVLLPSGRMDEFVYPLAAWSFLPLSPPNVARCRFYLPRVMSTTSSWLFGGARSCVPYRRMEPFRRLEELFFFFFLRVLTLFRACLPQAELYPPSFFVDLRGVFRFRSAVRRSFAGFFPARFLMTILVFF